MATLLASIATYLAIACANRVGLPCSRLASFVWWSAIAGDRP